MNFRQGWRDRAAGLPIPELQMWTDQQQLNYERGRRACAAAEAKYHKIARRASMWNYPKAIALIATEKLDNWKVMPWA